jgi:hypothetical protein
VQLLHAEEFYKNKSNSFRIVVFWSTVGIDKNQHEPGVDVPPSSDIPLSLVVL